MKQKGLPETDLIEEKELLSLVTLGDETAFSRVFAIWARLLFPYLARMTGSSEDAEEIIQETMLLVWVHRDELPELVKPRSWLFRIASNRAYTWLSKNANRERQTRALGSHSEIHHAVEEAVSLNELRKHLGEAINKMPPKRKLVYQLSRDQGLSITEIADELAISRNTVKNTLSDALHFIREELKKSGHSISILVWLFLKN